MSGDATRVRLVRVGRLVVTVGYARVMVSLLWSSRLWHAAVLAHLSALHFDYLMVTHVHGLLNGVVEVLLQLNVNHVSLPITRLTHVVVLLDRGSLLGGCLPIRVMVGAHVA